MDSKNQSEREQISEMLNLINEIQDKLVDFQFQTGIDFYSVYYDDLDDELKKQISLDHDLTLEEKQLGESLIDVESSLSRLEDALDDYSENFNSK